MNVQLIKAILAGEHEPVNRAERRVWAQFKARDARRGRRARARVQAGMARHEQRLRAAEARGLLAAV